MRDASQYPITQPWGYDPSYPLNNGWHRGVDYGAPTGTPVVVNGTQIGLSGATGAVSGPHLHLGHWVGGNPVDPGQGGGFQINATTVLRCIYDDPVNGNYVHIGDADGSYWVYLHLSRIDVKPGQQLKGVNMPISQQLIDDETAVKQGYNLALLRDALPQEIQARQGNKLQDFNSSLIASEEHKQVIADRDYGKRARDEKWEEQITDLKAQLTQDVIVLKPNTKYKTP